MCERVVYLLARRDDAFHNRWTLTFACPEDKIPVDSTHLNGAQFAEDEVDRLFYKVGMVMFVPGFGNSLDCGYDPGRKMTLVFWRVVFEQEQTSDTPSRVSRQ